ncbi:hypothetical protein OOZ19_19260 [Saccharopolyspora sp. NFXS83]|uniref:hypothetical protein n=1 Tax=Saccharopolyspora sp. NFXS83 TaxID=2993560 RepID=UPI00224A91A4|nr:hypothetical protein [Saccharopolyspora sp. NFXS83]MCX2732383.1 hypothetical protein [Saccharopolyspora sp. NFXS83]
MSDTTWEIPAAAKAGGITISLGCQSISVTQGDTEVKIMKEQLGEVADKLYFLDMAFQADAETIVEALCAR